MLAHVVAGRHAVVLTEDGGEGGAVGEAAGVSQQGLSPVLIIKKGGYYDEERNY